ncbi:MAG: GHKL domain-containing protein [Lachnospiraceae bacterium]|nr:GHKL domain-containing protein [Lachnospiraceae bacterium]
MYSQTGNIAIDSIINYKLTKASEKGITVESNIVIPADIGIESVGKVIEKYNGIIYFKHNDNQFVVNIILYV